MKKILLLITIIIVGSLLVSCGGKNKINYFEYLQKANFTTDVTILENDSLIETVKLEFDDKKSSFKLNEQHEIYVQNGQNLDVYTLTEGIWLKTTTSASADSTVPFYKKLKEDMFDTSESFTMKEEELGKIDLSILGIENAQMKSLDITSGKKNSFNIKVKIDVGSRTWEINFNFNNFDKTTINLPN